MTESTLQNNQKSLEITDSAAKRILQLIGQEGKPNLKLRVAVDGGGCSGFQYKIDFDDKLNDDDLVFEKNGVAVVVDNMSLDYMGGSALDFVETLGAAHFEIKNPKASATCGCGNSFAV